MSYSARSRPRSVIAANSASDGLLDALATATAESHVITVSKKQAHFFSRILSMDAV